MIGKFREKVKVFLANAWKIRCFSRCALSDHLELRFRQETFQDQALSAGRRRTIVDANAWTEVS